MPSHRALTAFLTSQPAALTLVPGICPACLDPAPCGHVTLGTADGSAPDGAVLTRREFDGLSQPLPTAWTITREPSTPT